MLANVRQPVQMYQDSVVNEESIRLERGFPCLKSVILVSYELAKVTIMHLASKTCATYA